MMNDLEKINYNKKFVVIYSKYSINIYEGHSLSIPKIVLKTKEISNIIFNPIEDNMILVSFVDGSCKIYLISDKILEEKILFEGINNEQILKSKFNDLNTSIIASLNIIENEKQDMIKKIIIWDVRNAFYSRIINIEQIIDFKWNNFSEDLLEILTKTEMKLLNIKENDFLSSFNYDKYDKIKNWVFLDEKTVFIIKKSGIETKNVSDGKVLSSKSFLNIKDGNLNYIKDDIVIIIFAANFIFINKTSFEEILKIEKNYNPLFKFINGNNKNEILLKYYDNEDEEIIEISINIKEPLNIENYSDTSNIKENFYNKYQRRIYKYLSLLNFNENVINCNTKKKKYMEIKEIKDYFDKARNINIFLRKGLINRIFENAENININNKNIENDFNIIYLGDLKILWDLCKTEKLGERKTKMILEMEKMFNNNENKIKEFYIKIVKLLCIDDTNKKLVEIYLIFLTKYDETLKKIFQGDYVEENLNEIHYYYPIFTTEEYLTLFGREKISEKDIVIEFLHKAFNIQSYVYDNKELKVLVEEAKELSKNIPDLNNPIEFDNDNIELIWHAIKISILYIFTNLELIEGNQNSLGRLKNGIRTVINKKLLIDIENNNKCNDDIFNDKDKLACTLLLITNPCQALGNNSKFCANLLLAKPLSKEELVKFANENGAELKEDENNLILNYNNYAYKDANNLCLNNLSDTDFIPELKYNFNYLLNNYISNQKEIKSFLKKILKKKVFVEAYQILFKKHENIPINNDAFLEEYIDKRMKFVPIMPFGCAAFSDKISLYTYISINKKEITNNLQFKNAVEILNTGKYVLIGEHEIFHILNCTDYYESNCSTSIETPQKKNYDGRNESGEYLELLLFNNIIKNLNLAEVLYILNESNYDKSLIEFRTDFEKLKLGDIENDDIIIKGIFKDYNISLNCNNTPLTEILKSNTISVKSSELTLPSIKFELQNCVIRRNKNN